MLTLQLDPALLADVQAASLESGMETGEWTLRSLRLAVAAAEAHARDQVRKRQRSARRAAVRAIRKGGQSVMETCVDRGRGR